ncbi:hypothetical protein PV10_00576 [Exophiala mesophila]|uniref:Mitochondrial inner membrane protease ATP23 n=1 Tax=Exophiala mesophila TaxID=212818 RepID=A0A0D1ZS18_EXOME|nr:uncharacterized protein PV10_00576 [Exophiala mesophila]KIV96754.1 hypothetical protein PV10_00576 [Exophiala mesophila]
MADPNSSDSQSSTTPSKPSSSSIPWNGNTFIATDTSAGRWKMLWRAITNQLPPDELKKYWWDRDQRNSELDCRMCEKWRDDLLKTSPVIVYMNQQIAALGGDVGKHNIRCRTCPQPSLGGFDSDFGIKICANYVDSKSKMEDTIAHEMVHAYDILRFRTLLDQTNLKHAACSEIRASNLSGECRWANEFFGNKFMKFTNHHQECVRRRAVQSLIGRPDCKDDVKAVKAVNEVWDSCFADTRPFDEIYR